MGYTRPFTSEIRAYDISRGEPSKEEKRAEVLEYTRERESCAPTRSHDLLMNDYATICPGTAAIAIY